MNIFCFCLQDLSLNSSNIFIILGLGNYSKV
jgi:hypothetical protein